MKKISEEKINQIVLRIELDWFDIQNALILKVNKEFPKYVNTKNEVKFEVKLQQIEEGSPSYKTEKYRAYITFTENLK